MVLTNEQLEAIRKRAEKATKGPWAHANSIVCTMYDGYEIADVSCGENPSEDAEFIMNARTDIPKLLAEVERYKEVERNLREITDRAYVTSDPQLFRMIFEIKSALYGGDNE